MDKWINKWGRRDSQELSGKYRMNEGVAKAPHSTNTVTAISSKNCLWMQKLVEKRRIKTIEPLRTLKISLMDYKSKNITFLAEKPAASTPTTGPQLTVQWQGGSTPCTSWEDARRGTQHRSCGSAKKASPDRNHKGTPDRPKLVDTKWPAVFFTGEGSWR